jgi:hypothetical protein
MSAARNSSSAPAPLSSGTPVAPCGAFAGRTEVSWEWS